MCWVSPLSPHPPEKKRKKVCDNLQSKFKVRDNFNCDTAGKVMSSKLTRKEPVYLFFFFPVCFFFWHPILQIPLIQPLGYFKIQMCLCFVSCNFFFQTTAPDLKWVDKEKPLFKVCTKLVSTVNTLVSV